MTDRLSKEEISRNRVNLDGLERLTGALPDSKLQVNETQTFGRPFYGVATEDEPALVASTDNEDIARAVAVFCNTMPTIISELRYLREENEKQLERIRELGFMREEGVKALEWALDEIGEDALSRAGNKGEWACRVLAVLEGRREQ